MEIPMAVFHVQSGQRYRFRFVNTMSHLCSAQFEIENHSMEIISGDAFETQPVIVDRIFSTSGQRFDFVLSANHTAGKKIFCIENNWRLFINTRNLEATSRLKLISFVFKYCEGNCLI